MENVQQGWHSSNRFSFHRRWWVLFPNEIVKKYNNIISIYENCCIFVSINLSTAIKMTKQTNRNLSIPYDKLWKSIVTEHFEDFLEMFLHDLHQEVDYNIPFKFLEQEIRAALIDKTLKQMDKLVRVNLKSGEEKWIFIHVEFETSHKPITKERMYDYHSRIKEKYGRDITALVIYTGREVPANPNIYEKTTFGTTIIYKFNTYIINEQDENELKANQNPFSIVVLANLYTVKTYGKYEERLTFKEQIYVLARQRNYSDEKTHKLILFLTELMRLPEDLETQFDEYISKPQNSTDMMPTTWRSRNVADALGKQAYGKTFAEMDASITSAIIRLYSKVQMSIDEIAETLQMEKEAILSVLKKHKLIKIKNK